MATNPVSLLPLRIFIKNYRLINAIMSINAVTPLITAPIMPKVLPNDVNLEVLPEFLALFTKETATIPKTISAIAIKRWVSNIVYKSCFVYSVLLYL